MLFVFNHSDIFRPVLIPPAKNRYKLSEQPLHIYAYIYPDLVVGIACPVFALTIGVATVDLGAEILATAAGPRGT